MEEIKKEEIQKDPNPPFPKPDAEKSNNENIYDQYQKVWDGKILYFAS